VVFDMLMNFLIPKSTVGFLMLLVVITAVVVGISALT